MKTVRFSQVVKKAGKPSVHLQLVDASEDRELKQAAKLHRVMTISQSTVGHATDYGTVGLDPDLKGQVLVFPKSLSTFAGRRVVGIKYEMLGEPEIPKSKLAPKVPPKKKLLANKAKQGRSRASSQRHRQVEPASDLVAALADPHRSASGTLSKRKRVARSKQKQGSDDPTQAGIREALQALRDGHSVKAHKILKTLLPEGEA